MKKLSLQKEIFRKMFHLMEVPLLLVYTLVRQFFSERLATLALTAIFLLLLEVEYLRLEHRVKLPEFIDVLRVRERNNVTGAIFFSAATIIVFAAFDYPIAVTALLLTVFGDLVSALVGIKFGRHHLYKSKTFEGFMAGLLVNCLVGYVLLPSYPGIFLTMAFVASFVELYTGKLDDNLTVPLFAAFSGQMISYMFRIPLAIFPGPIIGWLLGVFGIH